MTRKKTTRTPDDPRTTTPGLGFNHVTPVLTNDPEAPFGRNPETDEPLKPTVPERVRHQDMSVKELARLPIEDRCVHRNDPADCSLCRPLTPANKARCPKHSGYPIDNCYDCKLQEDIARAREQAPLAPRPPEKPAVTEDSVKKFLGMPDPDYVPSAFTFSRRSFYRPLRKAERLELGWPEHLDGMSVENIATFLTMPEFIYEDYEQNKSNPPKWIFVPAKESFDRPAHKQADVSVVVDEAKFKSFHGANWTVAPVGDEIQQRSEPIVIQVIAIPPKRIWRKIPVPPELLEALKEAEAGLEPLTAKWNKEHGNRTAKELASKRTLQYREINKIKEEVAKYDKVQWIDDPTTGCPERDIEIPPCPEGAKEVFLREAIRVYVREAFNPRSDDETEDWDYRFAALENKVIERMHEQGFACGWPPVQKTWRQWQLAGRPAFGTPEFQELDGRFYGEPKNGRQSDPLAGIFADRTATDNAEQGYHRSVGGYVADRSIRNVGPSGNKPDTEKK